MKTPSIILLGTVSLAFGCYLAMGAEGEDKEPPKVNPADEVIVLNPQRTRPGAAAAKEKAGASNSLPAAVPAQPNLSVGRGQPGPGGPRRPPVPQAIVPAERLQSGRAPRRPVKLPEQDEAFNAARARMVSNQGAGGITGLGPKVLEAMANVPRHQFVPAQSLAESYENKALDIGYGRTIESPSVIASVAQQLDPKPSDRILEIGTGAGYQTAILSHLVKEIYSVEPSEELAQGAEVNFKRLGYTNNVFVRRGEASEGWPEAAPFDGIIWNRDSEDIPDALINQLKPDGRVILTVDKQGRQHVLQKQGAKLARQTSRSVRLPETGGNETIIYPEVKIRKVGERD